MHETETFERVKQGRADAAERRTAELASDLHSHSHSHCVEGSSQYGSTDKVAGSGSGSVPPASAALTVTSSSRMEELKHTYYFYKYHMLGNSILAPSLRSSLFCYVLYCFCMQSPDPNSILPSYFCPFFPSLLPVSVSSSLLYDRHGQLLVPLRRSVLC